ncbi:Histone lysine methyltransferase Set3 [Schizosaccharomyces pombe]|uniref:SET domain-containing protein 3 n=1 Tax=Schizosaccharomyces pombe (strain 972 / ATCC 24843) TaxID=284812 RepID=SET3_SCHPO|nr:histone lysine methyltransferase Set3 [Schizosaccharomyces pombe]Q10362.1 RecName: Full=SET domain-containing protein 3 [Schizosaccharomyces pombe 972h-]CAA93898.1 histone lysine methyltransferase Set3 [Schizosaccharomyces pombe]|eukprot:NP_594837.1 histone lysine methyltransferase Set3 [Schizosaccharomyces pombe]
MWKIRCVCPFEDDDGFTIQCESCEVWQHAVCVNIDANNVPEKYFCEQCQPRPIDADKAHKIQLARLQREEEQSRILSRSRSSNNKRRTSFGKNGASPTHSASPRQGNNTGANGALFSQSTNSSNSGSYRNSVTGATLPNAHAPHSQNRRRRSNHLNNPPEAPITEASNEYVYSFHLEYVPLESNTFSASALEYSKNLDLKNLDESEVLMDGCQVVPISSSKFCCSRFGLVSTCEIPPNTPIMEVKGRVCTQNEYKSDPKNQYNILGAPKPHVFFDSNSQLVVDSRVAGSKARFARKGCQSNSVVSSVYMNGSNSVPRFILYSTTHIAPETEIIGDWTLDISHPFRQFAPGMSRPSFNMEELELLSEVLSTFLSFNECASQDKKNCVFSRVTKYIKAARRASTANRVSVAKDRLSLTPSSTPSTPSPAESLPQPSNPTSVYAKSLKEFWLDKYRLSILQKWPAVKSLPTESVGIDVVMEPKLQPSVKEKKPTKDLQSPLPSVEEDSSNRDKKTDIADLHTDSKVGIADVLSPISPDAALQSDGPLKKAKEPEESSITPTTPPSFNVGESLSRRSASPLQHPRTSPDMLDKTSPCKRGLGTITTVHKKHGSVDHLPSVKRRRSIANDFHGKPDYNKRSLSIERKPEAFKTKGDRPHKVHPSFHRNSDSKLKLEPSSKEKSGSMFFNTLRTVKDKSHVHDTQRSSDVNFSRQNGTRSHSPSVSPVGFSFDKSPVTTPPLPTAPAPVITSRHALVNNQFPTNNPNILDHKANNGDDISNALNTSRSENKPNSNLVQGSVVKPSNTSASALPTSAPKKLSLSEYRQRRQQNILHQQSKDNQAHGDTARPHTVPAATVSNPSFTR